MNLFSELKRRGVLRTAALYLVAAWLVMQVAEVVIGLARLPDWLGPLVLATIAVGFPIALALSWFYAFTPEGLVPEREGTPEERRQPVSGRRTPLVIIAMLSAALILFALERFAWRDEAVAPSGQGPAATGAPTLAVLPFVNRSSVAEDAYFVDGIHDDILTRLAKIESLSVVSRTSVMRFRDTDRPIPEIGRELGVGYILEGGVQRAGNHVRITAQLIDAPRDSHLWAETFDRELSTGNLFAIQSEIARAIATALDAELSPTDRRSLDRVPTDSLDAYDAYLLGRQSLLENSVESTETALAQFQQALTLDPGFAAAYAGVCEAHLSMYARTRDARHYDEAQTACTRALALDDSLAEVHVALGTLLRRKGDYAGAEARQRKALASQPQNIDALIELGLSLALQGRTAEARDTLLEAERLQPDHWPIHDTLFDFYRNFDDQPNRYELSVQHAMRVVELAPDSPAAWNNLGTAYHSLQQFGAARSAWDKALELAPTRTAYTNRGLSYYYEGRYADAAEMQSKAAELAPNDHRVWGRLAESYRLLGGREQQAAEAYGKAIRLAEGALRINDKDWRTHGLLATYYVHSDQPDAATAAVQAALEISGRDPEALLYAALVAHQRGDAEGALQALEEMVERDESFRQYAADDPDLRSLSGNPRFDRLVNP